MAYDQELASRLRAALETEPDLTEKSMFGGRAFLLHGNLVVSASSRGGLLLRVDPEESDDLLAAPHVERFEMRGREMAGWLHVASAGVGTTADLERWVEVGVRYVRTLPAK
jgi:TfoX/Sxy family transcriptional regulator of competence genes